MSKGFNGKAFLWRWLFAVSMVVITWNPSGYSWLGWFLEAENKTEAFLILSGVVLAIGWAVFINATLNSLGAVGLGFGAAFLASILWVLVQYEVLSLSSFSVVAWVVLLMFGTLLGVGVSWSHIRRRLSGQVDVDEIERT